MSWVRFLKPSVKNHLVAATGEYVGTFLFLFMGIAGAQVANSKARLPTSDTAPDGGSDPSLILYIAMTFGLSLAVNVWIFYRVSGGMFNPAVSLALVLGGGLPIPRAIICVVAQLLGAISASAVLDAMLPGKLLVNTGLGGDCSVVQGLFIEMFLTAQLIITIFMLAAEKTKATFLAPLGIGMSLFVAHLAGVYYTGASLNPARSFGPAVATRTFNKEHWIYWVGPLLGALLATGFYKGLKFLEYEAANPDQDIDLSCSAQEDHSRVTCSARSSAPIDGKELSQPRTTVRPWSRSKESDLESGSIIQGKSSGPTVAITAQSEDQIMPMHN